VTSEITDCNVFILGADFPRKGFELFLGQGANMLLNRVETIVLE
jgi:hypothetical protein